MKSSHKAFAFLTAAFLSSCAIAEKGKNQPYPEPEPEFLPIVMKFKIDGTPVIEMKDGSALEGKAIRPPIRTTLVESFETFSFIKYKGSCKMSFLVAGEIIEYDLPEKYCKQSH